MKAKNNNKKIIATIVLIILTGVIMYGIGYFVGWSDENSTFENFIVNHYNFTGFDKIPCPEFAKDCQCYNSDAFVITDCQEGVKYYEKSYFIDDNSSIQEWDYKIYGNCSYGYPRVKIYGNSYCNATCIDFKFANSTYKVFNYIINLTTDNPQRAIPALNISLYQNYSNCQYKCYGNLKGYSC